MSTEANKLNYEKAIAELEAIVAQMEAGQLPLEKALAQYKRGAELIKQCQQALSQAEQQVSILQDDANGQLSPFEPTEE